VKISNIENMTNHGADSGALAGGCISVARSATSNVSTGSRSALSRSASSWRGSREDQASSSGIWVIHLDWQPVKISNIENMTNHGADSGTLAGGCIRCKVGNVSTGSRSALPARMRVAA